MNSRFDQLLKVSQSDGKLVAEGDQSASFGDRLADGSGIFAEWSWDGKQLVATTDPLGMIPIFYWSDEQNFVISSSLIKLVERCRLSKLDTEALSTFFHLGFFLDDDTPFLGVKILPPNGKLVFDGTLYLREKRFVSQAHSASSAVEAMDEYLDRFSAAVRKRLDALEGMLCIPLGGGEDSRHILLELLRQNAPIGYCITATGLPPKQNDEGPARRLCARLDVQHFVVKPRTSRFNCEFRKNALTHFLSDEHGWFVSVADRLACESRRVTTFDGIGGDVLSASLFQCEESLGLWRSGNWSALAESLMPRDLKMLEPALPDGFLPRKARDIAINKVAQALRKCEGSVNPLTMFFFWSRTRREISLQPFGMLNSIAKPMTPYLDSSLVHFLAGLPSEMLIDKKFHRRTIARGFRQYADLPYAPKLAPNLKRHHLIRHIRYVTEILAYAMRSDSSWTKRIGPILYSWGRCVADGRYRSRHRYLSPPWWLYVVQLDQLRKGRLHRDIQRHFLPFGSSRRAFQFLKSGS